MVSNLLKEATRDGEHVLVLLPLLFPNHRLGLGQVTVEAGSSDPALHSITLILKSNSPVSANKTTRLGWHVVAGLAMLFWWAFLLNNSLALHQQAHPHHHTSTSALHCGKHTYRNHLFIFSVSHKVLV